MAFDPVTAISDLIGKALSFIPNPAERQAAEQAMRADAMNAAQQITLAQLDLNKVEAASASPFVSGWRPAIGWICAAALAFQYLIRPVAPWLANAFGANLPELPGLDDNLWQLMLGMLGLGGMRTYEKVSGVVPTQAGRR